MAGWVWPAIQIGGAIIGGLMSSNAANRNANDARNIAYGNAANIQRYGQAQSSMLAMTTAYNAKLIKAQAKVQGEARYQIAQYNSELLNQIAAYNSLLYSSEIDSIMEALELDSTVLRIGQEKARGTVEAIQGASGTVLGQDSNADVLIQMKADEALEQLVMRTNADTKAKSLLNAAAQGEWQARMEGQKMLYEAKVSGEADMLTASMQAKASVFNGLMEMASLTQSTANRAWSTVSEGLQQSRNARDMANYHRTKMVIDSAKPVYDLLS